MNLTASHKAEEVAARQTVFHLYLRTFARKFSNIDFFPRLLPLKVDELVTSEM